MKNKKKVQPNTPELNLVEIYKKMCTWGVAVYGEQNAHDFIHSAYVELFSEDRRDYTLGLSVVGLEAEWMIYSKRAMLAFLRDQKGIDSLTDLVETESVNLEAPVDPRSYIKGLLKHLPQPYKRVLYLKVIDRATEHEIARELGISRLKVQRSYATGIQHLQSTMQLQLHNLGVL